jgi:large subunit ribosomal protein L7/L12
VAGAAGGFEVEAGDGVAAGDDAAVRAGRFGDQYVFVAGGLGLDQVASGGAASSTRYGEGMAGETDKLKAQLAKAQAMKDKYARKAQALGSRMAQQQRRDDTRRKILDGAVVAWRCEQSPEFAAELHQWRAKVLTRDDDRALFGLEPLPVKEGEASSASERG